MAGHSKWANIKHRKARQDAKRGKVFTKIIREITVAAKGGPDPADNPRLRLALDKANSENMPKDTITRAIQKGSGTGGIAIYIETVTDNRNRTVAEVRHAFSKFGGNLGTDGSVSYLFNKIGIIHLNKEFSEEEIMDFVIEYEADDFIEEDEFYEIITSPSSLHAIVDKMKENNIDSINAELTLRPETTVLIDEEMSEKVIKLMNHMDDLDDVQEVHTNAEFPANFEMQE